MLAAALKEERVIPAQFETPPHRAFDNSECGVGEASVVTTVLNMGVGGLVYQTNHPHNTYDTLLTGMGEYTVHSLLGVRGTWGRIPQCSSQPPILAETPPILAETV